MAKHIPLTKGFSALVDDEDYEWLSQWKWTVHSGAGGRISAYRKSGQGKSQISQNVWMHRAILSAPEEMEVDHVNGDALDNRRANLRLVTRSQNLRNRKTFKNNKSGYKGVVFDPKSGKWKVTINLGTFDTAEEAARAYDEGVRMLFGRLAKLNLDN